MYNVTESFIENSRQQGRQLSYLITYDDVTLTSDDIEEFSKDFEGDFFRTIMQTVEGKLIGRHDLTDKVLNIKVGVSYEGSPVEYIDYGFFIVTEHTRIVGESGASDKTEFKASDHMLNAHTLYDVAELGITYPITVINLFKAIVSHVGGITDVVELVNGNQIIQEDKYTNIENITYRNILDEISEVSGTSIMISDNKFIAKKVFIPNEAITWNDIKTKKWSEM